MNYSRSQNLRIINFYNFYFNKHFRLLFKIISIITILIPFHFKLFFDFDENQENNYRLINKVFNEEKLWLNYSELIIKNTSLIYNINQNKSNKVYTNKKNDEIIKKQENNLFKQFNKNQSTSFDLKINDKNRMQQFIKLCMEGKLLDKTKYALSPNPKISVIKPVFNGLKYLSYTLRSIQNQKMEDFEIIFVDDFSTENRFIEQIQKYQEEEPRIKLIRNNREMGVLYTLCIGILNAKGENILLIDQDDLYIDELLFNIIYEEIKNKEMDIDIVKFIRAKGELNNLSLEILPNAKSTIIYQPSLSHLGLTDRFANRYDDISDSNNYFDMLVKAEVYRKAVDKIGEKLYKRFLISYTDDFLTFVLFKVAKKYKRIEKFGMYKCIHTDSATSIFFGETKRIKHSLDLITFFDILYLVTENNEEDKNIIAFKLSTYRHRYKITDNWYGYAYHVFSKYLANKFINREYKKGIQNILLSLSKKQKKNKAKKQKG